MKNLLTTLTIVGTLMFLAAPAVAEWNEGDPAKWVQWPDPNGWDVNMAAPHSVADDFQCTQRGPIGGIHFWFSAEGDNLDGALRGFDALQVKIHSDRPDPDGDGPRYSMPGEVLWQRIFDVDQIHLSPDPWGEGEQGWADPIREIWHELDHNLFWQANIENIPRPFMQQGSDERPVVYWLEMATLMHLGTDAQLGWKTAQRESQWNDDAVYWGPTPGGGPGWNELWEYGEFNGRSLDMAFVIVPEPGTLAMLAGVGLLGLFAFVRCRQGRNA